MSTRRSSSSSQTDIDVNPTDIDDVNPTDIDVNPTPDEISRNLRQAILGGDLESVREVHDTNPEALGASITESSDTPLMIAVSGHRFELIQHLLDFPPVVENLARRNKEGNTALHEAIIVGHVEAAELLVQRNGRLLSIRNNYDQQPLHTAAAYCQGEILHNILRIDEVYNQEDIEWGIVMHLAIDARLFDVARILLRRLPELAREKWELVYPLERIAGMPTVFPSGTNLNTWQRFIYNWAPLDSERFQDTHNDVENPAESSQASQAPAESSLTPTISCWHRFLSKDYFLSVPHVKNIRETKLIHCHAQLLVTELCKILQNRPESRQILKNSFRKGAEHGILEIVEQILSIFPDAISAGDEPGGSLPALHLAAVYRRKNIFNYIIQQKRERVKELLAKNDLQFNNILHLVGQMPRQPQLELVSGAILRMQDELKWYKGVEKLVSAQARAEVNVNGKTPSMVFDEEHRPLMQSEREWIVSMAGACTVATTIIGTIAFAAAVQPPGGNNSEGHSVLYKEAAFKVFAVSNAVALYSAISTFLIFLSIYTTRYAAIDFLYALPKRLIIGMIVLFLSVTSTLIAFGSTLCLMFSQERKYKILTPVIILSSVPVILFTSWQFPLLLNMIKTTYDRSMFSPLDERKSRRSNNITRKF